jgi:hypothetical protein
VSLVASLLNIWIVNVETAEPGMGTFDAVGIYESPMVLYHAISIATIKQVVLPLRGRTVAGPTGQAFLTDQDVFSQVER